MLASSAVTFWRWLTGQPIALEALSGADAQPTNRRVWLRYAANLNIRAEQVSGEVEGGILAVLCDISRGGVQIIAPRRFEPGTILSVELPSTQGEERLAVLACVVRAHPHGDSEWTMGCRFASELDQTQLQAFGAARERPSNPDPRGWSRFPCDAKAFIQRVNGTDPAYRPARVLNVAVGGMALLVSEPIAIGELLSTELHDGQDRPIVSILACVVHVHSAPEGQILGCTFIRELSDHDVRALL